MKQSKTIKINKLMEDGVQLQNLLLFFFNFNKAL